LRISNSGKKKVLNKKEKIEAEPHYGCILLPPERAAVNTRVKTQFLFLLAIKSKVFFFLFPPSLLTWYPCEITYNKNEKQTQKENAN
jgi:hypothetical protein